MYLSKDFQKKPILIVGSMRSGTTLLGRMLDAHPSLSLWINQTNFLRFYGIKSNSLSEKENAIYLIDKIRKHLLSFKASFSDEQYQQIIEFLDNEGYSYQNIYLALALFLFNAKPSQRWGEKYAGDCRDVNYFFNVFPEGQVICIRRNIFDVFASEKKRVSDGEDLEPNRRDLPIIEEWQRCNQRYTNFLNLYGKHSIFRVDYEDLVNFPEKETKKICNFLNVDWHHDMVTYEKFFDDKEKQWEANTSFEKLNGIDKTNISKHLDILSQEEIFFVNNYLKIKKSENSRFQDYYKKLRHAFLTQGKYSVALFVESFNTENKILANFLHQSYLSDLTVITTKMNKEEKYDFKVIQIDKNSNFDIIKRIFENKDYHFLHMHGPQFVETNIFNRLKDLFNLELLITKENNIEFLNQLPNTYLSFTQINNIT